jgi:hypothetical protein
MDAFMPHYISRYCCTFTAKQYSEQINGFIPFERQELIVNNTHIACMMIYVFSSGGKWELSGVIPLRAWCQRPYAFISCLLSATKLLPANVLSTIANSR